MYINSKWLYSNVAFFIFFTSNLVAQNVAINTTGATADPSSLLEVGTGNPATGGDTKGVLIPRVALTDVTVAAPVTAPATSLVVFNTNASVIGGIGAGFYWWDGTKWAPMGTQGPMGASGSCLPTSITTELDAGGSPTASGALKTLNQCSTDCYNLVYSGYSDWRMPTLDELINLTPLATNKNNNAVWTISESSTNLANLSTLNMSTYAKSDAAANGGTITCRCVR